ncbi:MFS transporter [Polaribacter sp. Hel1_85]|uniref:MFS transporter n=1 Tax=Polaribacter sp. Hel1_85 TaxID=1250005 RepID=UPI00052D92E7|nr:MFS transporter [Polaribacter sp. Hel1_85]KGL63402.1 MFS transporter [Polaribacter sp. Hel1_85]
MQERNLQRISLSTYFLLSGICFSSWASRIPTIKDNFNFSEEQLGNMLMIMPASAVIGIPLSGCLVSKYDSRIPQQFAYVFFSIALLLIGFSTSLPLLIFALFLFAVSLRVLNISINTQSIFLQEKFEKRIVGAFHGLWSIGGIIGVLFTTLMLKLNVSIQMHFLMVAIFTLITIFIAYPYLIKNDKANAGNKFKLEKPNKYIMLLGLMVFLAAICEGGMYDWNGVYFKDVVKEEVFTYGYLLFMICMSIYRLTIDKLIDYFGMKKLYFLSSILIMSGVSIAVIVPEFWPALIGFCLVGIGVSGLFPMTFILAGKAKKYSTGIVISIVGTYSTVGMFLGPPLIGYLAESFGLQKAFIVFIIGGFLFIPLTLSVFNHLKKI